MKIIQRGRLKFGQLGGSVGIPPGIGYQAHRITVSNTEGGYPNTCENVKAEIVLTFLHTGETHRIAGLFSRTDGQKITSEPTQRVSLPMLESSELLLLCRDSINREFRTLSRWPFHPESEMRLEFGDWRLEVVASCDSSLDVAGVSYDVRLKPDLSSAWSPFQNLLPVSNTPRATMTLPKAFVSHSSQDQKFVENFAADLRANGVDAWYSGWEIKPGDSIRKKIDDGLEGCEYFIIVLSKNSISRPWVQAELDAATIGKLNGRVRRIIPIKIEDCGDLPPTLASLCWEDFSSQSYHSALKRVLYSVFEIDDKPPLGSPPTVAASERGRLQITSLTGASGDLPEPPTKPGAATSFPIHMDDLGVFAEQLRRDGFDARGDLFNGQVGLIVGPKGLDRKRMPSDAKGLFFPLWEINHKANRPLMSARKFHEVLESRPPDWLFNRPYTEEQEQLQQDSVEQPISASADPRVRLIGPHEVDLVFEVFHSQQGKHGVLAKLHNRRITNLSNCRVLLRDVRSFDVGRGLLRESSGFKAVRILGENCPAGFESRNAWLMRIEADHLEAGDTVGGGVMQWPTGDKTDIQKWRMFLSVAVEGSEEWMPEVDFDWILGSDTIRMQTGN